MKAAVFHGVGDIQLENINKPSIQGDFDAIVRLTASAICGTNLQSLVRADQSRAAHLGDRCVQTT
jgi:threonine dehydrogenase-like Zn-dependent dehydrogenase